MNELIGGKLVMNELLILYNYNSNKVPKYNP